MSDIAILHGPPIEAAFFALYFFGKVCCAALPGNGSACFAILFDRPLAHQFHPFTKEHP